MNKYINKQKRCQALIKVVPGFPSCPCQPPKRRAGLMQMHFTARFHQHEPKYMSKNQRPRVQLQEGKLGRPVRSMSESF